MTKKISETSLDKMISHSISRTLTTLENEVWTSTPATQEELEKSNAIIKQVIKKEFWLLDLSIKSILNRSGILLLDQPNGFDSERDESYKYNESGKLLSLDD